MNDISCISVFLSNAQNLLMVSTFCYIRGYDFHILLDLRVLQSAVRLPPGGGFSRITSLKMKILRKQELAP